MVKNTGLRGLLLFPALLLGSLFLISSCGRSKTTAAADVGEVIYFEGEVTLNGSPAEIGSEVKDGDVLVTGAASYAEVQFGRYRVLRSEENSTVTFDASSDTLKVDSGALAVVQSKARFLSKDKAWDVETPTTVAAVRGTFYYVKVLDDDNTYFCLCNGRIDLASTDLKESFDLEAKHHNAVTFTRTEDGITYEEAEMIYHTDDDMESLADKVNIKIDWDEVS